MKKSIHSTLLFLFLMTGGMIILWGGGTKEHVMFYLAQWPWILLLAAGAWKMITYIHKTSYSKKSYFNILHSFIYYLFLATAFRARMESLAEYAEFPEYAPVVLISLTCVFIFQNIPLEFWQSGIWVGFCVLCTFVLQILSMGNKKTGLLIAGARVQVLIFVVFLDLVFIFPYLLKKREKTKKDLLIFFAVIGVQTILFLMASECGTLLVLLVSCVAIWIRYCKIHNEKETLFLSFFILILGSVFAAVYVKITYGNYEAGLLEGRVLSLFQKIGVKAGQRLFQSNPYQYERALNAMALSGWSGNGRDYLIEIPNATTDLPFLHSIQIFGALFSFLLLPLLLSFIRNLLTLQKETEEEKQIYVQIRDAGIIGFFIGSFLFSLFSQLTGVIIGIPLLFLSRSTTWNLTALILLLLLLTSSDEGEEAVKKRKEEYRQYKRMEKML